MPTRKPRLSITLSPSQADLFKRLAELRDTSASKVVLELLVEVEPMLREIVVALEAAQAAKGKPAARLISAVSRLQSRMQDLTQHAVDQADMFSGKVTRVTSKLRKKPPVRATGKAVKRGKRSTG